MSFEVFKISRTYFVPYSWKVPNLHQGCILVPFILSVGLHFVGGRTGTTTKLPQSLIHTQPFPAFEKHVPNVGQKNADHLYAADNTACVVMWPYTNINWMFLIHTCTLTKSHNTFTSQSKQDRDKAKYQSLYNPFALLRSCWFMEPTDCRFMRSHLRCSSFWAVRCNINL